MHKYKEKIIYGSYFVLVFGFLLVVFLKIHPLVIFNSDDWLYASYDRIGTPLWGEWNPCRVLPENMMSWVTYVCAFVLMPLFDIGFMDATIIGYGVWYSICIMIYFVLFVMFLKKKKQLPLFLVISISLIFFIMHFMVYLRYINDGGLNQHMFMALYTTCIFYYAIPNLWNAGLVFYLLTFDVNKIFKERRYVRIGILLLMVYLAVFSDLFQTIILISFVSYRILICLIEQIRKYKKEIGKIICETVRNTILECSSIVVWLISLVFEINGGRSDMLGGGQVQITANLKSSIEAFFSFYKMSLSKMFIVSFVGVFIVAVVIFLVKRKKQTVADKSCLKYILCFTYCLIICSIFEILLGAKIYVGYLNRADVMFGCTLYMILIFVVLLVYVLQNVRIFSAFIPLYIYVIVSFSIFFSHSFMINSSSWIPYQTCKEIGESIIEQITQADEQALKEVTVHVPNFGENINNYPLNTAPYEYTTFSFGYIVSDALYKYDIIHRPIVVKIQPDNDMNHRFHMD